MMKRNYFGVSDSSDETPMEMDQIEEQINTSSQSDSKLYEGINKNSDAKHSFSETVTKKESKTNEKNDSSRDDNKDILSKKCIENRSGDAQESKRDPVRAESMIRQTITKMKKHRTVIPGMASARSLTNLISADYGWTPSAVYSKVEEALKSAADHGIIKEIINKGNGQRSYTIPDAKVRKYVRNFHLPPGVGGSKTHFHKHFSDLMNGK